MRAEINYFYGSKAEIRIIPSVTVGKIGNYRKVVNNSRMIFMRNVPQGTFFEGEMAMRERIFK